MKQRIRLALVGSALAVAAVVGLTVPTSALSVLQPVEPCDPAPVLGEDGQPPIFCTPTGVDTVRPVVHIYNPTTSTVKRNQTVMFTALGTDNVGVVSVKLYVDGVLVSTSNSSTAGSAWTPTVRGDHTLKAEAYDAAGNVGQTSRVVSVR